MAAGSQSSVRSQLITLSHALGQEDRDLAILGEGNTSARTGESTPPGKSV